MNTKLPWIRNSRNPLHRFVTTLAALAALGVGLAPASARADTTITTGSTVTIDGTNTTLVGSVRTWNEVGTLNMANGSFLQVYTPQTFTVNNNAAIVFSGTGGTITMRFNDNDTDHMLNGAISSTAAGAQLLDVYTGYAGNGDRESVTFNKGIPDVGDGSAMSLKVTFRPQAGTASSWVNLKGNNTFTGPISLVRNGTPTAFLTIGGALTKNNSNTIGSGTLNGGNYAGDISNATGITLNYASTAAQTLSGIISGGGALQVTGNGPLTLSGGNTYSGTSTVNSGCSLILGSTGGLKFVITDSSNNKVTGAGSATMNGIFTLDTSAVTVPSGTWTLINTTTKSFGSNFGLTGFTGPAGNIFTMTSAGKTWTFDKSTGILSLSSNAVITSFGIPGSLGTINQVAKTIALTVPYNTNLATLAPTFTLTSGTCNPTSGNPPSPSFGSSNPATYTVTDGSTVNNYAVTVSITPASTAKNLLTCDFGSLGAASLVGSDFTLSVPPSQQLSALAPTFTLSAFASVSPLSGSTQDFTNPVTYTVTAQDGSTKDYTVTVQSYESWANSGSMFILTTPDGANIAAGASETNFPLLIRLNTNNFNFAQAASDGIDIRFATAAGMNLSYQIEQWDSVNQTAAVWVKIPTITGNARQEIKMYWGKAGVSNLSSGSSVFSSSNGYASVVHLGNTLTDEVGTSSPSNVNTTVSNGLIGKGRTFASGQGVLCGKTITGLPTGVGPFSTGVWIRPSTGGTSVLGWGLEPPGGGKVVIQLPNPPHINLDCHFGGANVTGTATIPTTSWSYVVHTFQSNSTKLYVNGVLDASNNGGSMSLPTSVEFYIGGWGGYSFVGDMDEVRISNVVRSANWVKLEYENQKPLQTLVGNLVQAGSTFSASPSSVTMNEGEIANFTGQAGGAQKVSWIMKENGVDTVLSVDQFGLSLPLGRVTGTRSFVIQFKANYPTEIKTVDIPVTINEAIPDPVFTLTAPATWNGRNTITVSPEISNLAALQAAGAANFTYNWSVNGVAVIKTITPGVLTLLRSQGSGPMNVSLTMDNGGSPATSTKTITVQEPASDAWLERTPLANEKPVNNQFFARNPNTSLGTVFYNGTQSGSPDTVYLKVYKTPSGGAETIDATYRQPLVGGAYAFSAPIAAGLTTYHVVYGTTTGATDTDLATVTNLICGDAFIIEGQSNALATDNSEPSNPAPSPWIRSYGKTLGWGDAVNKSSLGERQLGVWGLFLAQRLLANNDMPICIINGAKGGTRIDQHMPNTANHALAKGSDSIYADLYNRVTGAKLTHGIRAVLWHQGENDQGSDGPDGDYDYKFYQQYFVDMTAAWKQDFPNILKYYVFQIWPAACGDTSRNDQLREVQRTLPRLYSNMKMMSTLGIVPGSGCHYVAAGYQVFSDLIGPLIEQDTYGISTSSVFTAANLEKAYFTSAAHNEIALQFDQDISWNPGAPGLLYIDGVAGKVTNGSATGKVIKLQLNAPSTAATITYLKGLATWYQPNILYGIDGIAALTFADVPIADPASPYSQWSADPAQGLTAGVNDGPLDDPDFDGVKNLLEFVLGSNPMVSSQTSLPALSGSAGNWVFEYDRSDLSLPPATTQAVEYGNTLTGWTSVSIPITSAGTVTITPGSPAEHVSVAIPDLGPIGFARLRVSE